MKSAFVLAAAIGTAAAMPAMMDNPIALKMAREFLERRQQDPLGVSKGQTNCGGLVPCTTFDEQDQLVDVHGEHAYVAPGAGDIRGPCPGLNAAANHGYLPRNG